MEFAKLDQLAVVTGASSGIGFELARQFAQNGYSLLIADQDEGVYEVQSELEQLGADVTSIMVDLSAYEGVENLYHAIQEEEAPLSILAIHASVGEGGEFIRTKLKKEIELINSNITSVVHLTKRVLRDFYQMGQGKILFMSEVTPSTYMPLEAVYAGTQAFVASFAEALRKDCHEKGVQVSLLIQGKEDVIISDVARQTYSALIMGEEKIVVGGLKIKMQEWATKTIIDPFKTKVLHH